MPRRRVVGWRTQGHVLALVGALASGGTALSLDGRAALADAAAGTDCSTCTRRHKALLERRKPTEGCRIKGTISDAGERIYHVPGGVHYKGMNIDPAKGERWFCTEAEARAAGWKADRE